MRYFPAAQRSQEAEAGFQRMIKALGDAVVVQDMAALDLSMEEAKRVAAHLKAVAAIPGVTPERAAQSRKLASSVETFSADARGVYSAVLADPANMTAQTQERMREMASRTEALKTELDRYKEQSSKDLRSQLDSLQQETAKQSSLALIVFAATLVLASGIVSLTIRKSIVGPIARVIDGVQQAADQAAEASAQMAASGQVVARDAQDQAAYLQETSASLEQISATTRENANRASDADSVMRKARETVDQATRAVDDLTKSMQAISTSNKEVASVLKSIDEIAFYTNILALNAAVEAARAGEAGAGFSVVADEVRSLAQRAAEAARTSGDIVERTIADVEQGVSFVSTTHEAFHELSTMIVNSSEAVSQIAIASEEQTKGIALIDRAISRMEAVTNNNAANSQQTAESASAMSTQVQKTRDHLEELVAVVGLRRS